MSATIAVIAAIAAIAEKKMFSDRSDHKESTFQRSQRQRLLRYFYLSDRCRCDRWNVVSI